MITPEQLPPPALLLLLHKYHSQKKEKEVMTNFCDLRDKCGQFVARGPKVAPGQSPPGPEIRHGKQKVYGKLKDYGNLHLICEI